MDDLEFKSGDKLPVEFKCDEVEGCPELPKILACLTENVTKFGPSTSKVREIQCLLNNIKQLHLRCLKNETFMNHVCIAISDTSNPVPSAAVKKIEEVMLAEEFDTYCQLSSSDSHDSSISNRRRCNFFGLSELSISISNLPSYKNHSPLSMERMEKWHRTSHEGEKTFSENQKDLLQDQTSSVPLLKVCQEKLEVLNLNEELGELMKQHNESLVHYSNCLKEAANVRCSFVEEVDLRSGNLLLKRTNLHKSNAEILKHQMLLSHFSEDENIPKALNNVYQIIKNEACLVKQEIEELRQKKNSYEKLDKSAFNKALEDYVIVLQSIEKTKWLINTLEERSS